MLTLTTWEALAAVPFAHALLADRLADFRDLPLSDLCTVLVVEPGDTLTALGEPEYVAHHPGWYELVFVDGDDGFGRIVLAPDRPDIDPAILKLCRAG